MYRTLFIALLAIASTSSLAADDKTPPSMTYVTDWEGPFKETRIVKFADHSDGVACYVFMPMHVATEVNCRTGGCSTDFKDNIGSISCVKVVEKTPATPTQTTKSH